MKPKQPMMYFFEDDDDDLIHHGGPRRTKWTHPYNYDPIRIWRHPKERGNTTVYSDRMMQWDWDKYNKCRKEHFNDTAQTRWSSDDPKLIEAFLRDYMDDQTIILTDVIEYCNQATGFPVWRFDYFQADKETKQ